MGEKDETQQHLAASELRLINNETQGPKMTDSDLILRELRGFRQENKEQFETIKEEIVKVNTRMEEVEGRVEKAEERIQNTEEVITAMLKLHTKLEDKVLDLESRSRRENIRMYGVPEGSEKDSTTMISFVVNLLREGLELNEDMPDLQIERAHRSLGPQPPGGAPPRSIIIKFLSFRTKETILRKAWQGKGFNWQEHHINLDHDYPPLILKKRREYTEIRRVLKENNIQFQTIFPARLRVRYEDGTKTYDTVEEASEDLLRRGFTVTTIKPPETLMEQIQQLSWKRVDRRATKGAFKAGQGSSYKEKLRAFRRPSATPSGT